MKQAQTLASDLCPYLLWTSIVYVSLHQASYWRPRTLQAYFFPLAFSLFERASLKGLQPWRTEYVADNSICISTWLFMKAGCICCWYWCIWSMINIGIIDADDVDAALLASSTGQLFHWLDNRTSLFLLLSCRLLLLWLRHLLLLSSLLLLLQQLNWLLLWMPIASGKKISCCCGWSKNWQLSNYW